MLARIYIREFYSMKNHIVGLIAIAFACASGLSGQDRLAPYPEIEILTQEEGTQVRWNGRLLVEMKENRFLRFRATPENEQWIGAASAPIDLGWAYRDQGTKGLVVTETHHRNEPEAGRFVLQVMGRKPKFDSRVEVTIEATWLPAQAQFRYMFSTRLTCPLESWYAHSTSPMRGPASRGNRLWIEPIDYCIEGISRTERMLAPDKSQRGDPLLYTWFVRSLDGERWSKWPKVHIPFPVRPGEYLTIRDFGVLLERDSYYGFLDGDNGGWMTRIRKTSAPIAYEICWSRFDIHLLMEGAMPARHGAETLDLEFALEFVPVPPAEARKIVNRAVELPWRQTKEYQDLPLFSWDNRFDRVLTDLPSEETAQHMLWWPSGYDCFRDGSVGDGDSFSLSIKREHPAVKASAWTTLCWGYPFNDRSKGKRRYRLSARVKTADCTGAVRLGHYSSVENIGDIYYGGLKSHHRDGRLKTEGLVWEYSSELSGTNDWTLLSLEFEVRHYGSTLLLEHTGAGQCWFDNVKLEDLGPARGILPGGK